MGIMIHFIHTISPPSHLYILSTDYTITHFPYKNKCSFSFFAIHPATYRGWGNSYLT